MLIELLIVVVVLGILAAIAYPSYVEHVRRARRAEARAQLLEAAQYMQRFYSQNDRYDQVIGSTVTMTLPADLARVPRSGTAAYTIRPQAANLTATAFTLEAVPQGAMSADKCGTLRISNAGRREATGAATGGGITVEDCWR